VKILRCALVLVAICLLVAACSGSKEQAETSVGVTLQIAQTTANDLRISKGEGSLVGISATDFAANEPTLSWVQGALPDEKSIAIYKTVSVKPAASEQDSLIFAMIGTDKICYALRMDDSGNTAYANYLTTKTSDCNAYNFSGDQFSPDKSSGWAKNE
jgi:hypothetical protein